MAKEKSDSKKQPLILIVLIIVALFLGYNILKQKGLIITQPLNSDNKSAGQPVLNTPTANKDKDIDMLLHPPAADASTSAKQAHQELVARLAKPGTEIGIKDCKPNPIVLQVKQGEEFEINNMDNTDHSFTFDEDHLVIVPAGQKLKIKADFKYGTGDYGYVCQGLGLTGFLHISP